MRRTNSDEELDDLCIQAGRCLKIEDFSIIGPKLASILDAGLKLIASRPGLHVSIYVESIGTERASAPMLYFALSESRPVEMVVRYGKNAYYRLNCSEGGYHGGLPVIDKRVKYYDFELLGGDLLPFEIARGNRKFKDKLSVFLQQPEEGPRIKDL